MSLLIEEFGDPLTDESPERELLRMLNGNSPMFTGSGGGFGGQGIPGIGGMGPQMYGGTGGEYSDVGPYAPIG